MSKGVSQYIRKKILEWLLKDGISVKDGVVRVGNTIVITSDFIDLHPNTTDPAATSGRLWWRSDLRALRVSDGAETMSIVQAPHKILRPLRYFGAFDSATAFTTLALTANRLYAAPFFIPVRSTFDRIAINVTTGATGTTARMGIYRDSGDAYPSTLISGTDIGTVDTATTGTKENTISVTLNPGLYWLTVCSNGAPTLRAIPVASLDCEVLGLDSGLGTTPGVAWFVSYTYAALPSTFPTGATVDTGTHPLVALRRA